MIELDKCPHCGEAAELRRSRQFSPEDLGELNTWYVICTNLECEVRTLQYMTPEKAARVWNRRVQA